MTGRIAGKLGKLARGKDEAARVRSIVNLGELPETRTLFGQCETRGGTNEWKRADAKKRETRKEEQNSYSKHGTNDEILIVDHNFATIFRQPDGSAG